MRIREAGVRFRQIFDSRNEGLWSGKGEEEFAPSLRLVRFAPKSGTNGRHLDLSALCQSRPNAAQQNLSALAGDFDNDKALPECLRRVLQLRSASVSVLGLMKKAIVIALGTS
jgi:hypothetical protein